MKTAELTGAALDWAVAKAEDEEVRLIKGQLETLWTDNGWKPSTDWAQGGPIIERERIELVRGNDLYFPKGNEQGEFYEPLWIAGKMHGQTPLIAAMRCYVAVKLGDEIEIPTELKGE